VKESALKQMPRKMRVNRHFWGASHGVLCCFTKLKTLIVIGINYYTTACHW
jgi:hypothetical protein